jgi:uncharacterized membrane protein YgcG
MRRTIIAFVPLLAALAPAAAQERILQFVSDVMVERNGDLSVTETIRVQAEGREIRRGILRDFPTIYTGANGVRVEVGFEVQSVTRDGAPENFTTEQLANGVRLRIGSADRVLTNGPHTYDIRYRTTRQIGFFADYDELYWNATGTGWTFRIDVAEARITLPERVPFRQSAFYTGAQGAQGKDATVIEQQPGRIVFRTTRPLPPHNGLTVAAAWQKGVVEAPSAAQRATYWLQDNLAVPIALGGLALMLGFYVYAWLRVGRDPPRGTIIPLFGPPDGMSPAAVRYVENEGFDQRCFTAAIIDLAVNGHMKISGTGKSTTIERRDGGKPVASPERTMESRLFATKPSILLDQVNHEPIGKAREALQQGLKQAYLGKLFANNFGWSALGLVLSLVLIVAIVAAIANTHGQDQAALLVVGMLAPTPFIAFAAAMVYAGWQREQHAALLIIGGVVLAVFSAAVGLFVMYQGARGGLDLVPAIASYALAAIVGIAFRWLQAPTVEGRKVMDQIEGFRLYLSVAEEDRLEAMNPPDKTPELFERFLPYAIALDCENTWAKRFAGVLAAAAATATGATVGSWYAGQDNWSTNPVGFADHLGGALSQTIAAAATPPGTSGGGFGGSGGGGSSGGGSSGGGGGGGGGSGW